MTNKIPEEMKWALGLRKDGSVGWVFEWGPHENYAPICGSNSADNPFDKWICVSIHAARNDALMEATTLSAATKEYVDYVTKVENIVDKQLAETSIPSDENDHES